MAVKKKAKSKTPKALQRDVEREVLENGIRVITERVPGAAGVRLSVWVNAGSRYEDLTESGMTYLIQQMAFHGTENHTAAQIAKAIDLLGGKISTETGRDHAAYFAQVSPTDVEAALDLLAELTLRPKLPSTALSTESKKVLEELRAAEKEADFVLERMFYRSFWKGHGLCRPPKGRLLLSKGQTKLENFKPKSVQRYHQRSHHPLAITVIAAGHLQHDKMLEAVEKRYGSLAEPKKRVSTTTPANFKFLALRNRPQFSQIRFRIGAPACSASDSDRHAAGLLNAILGAGAGSRLASMARDAELPVDEAASDLAMFGDAGCFSVFARASRKNAQTAVEKIVQQLLELTMKDVPEDELERAKATRKANLVAAVDSLESRVEDLARAERYFGRLVPLQDELTALEAVKAPQIRALAANWFAPHYLSLALLGNLKGVNIRPNVLQW